MARKKKAVTKKAAPRKAKAKRKPGRPKGSRNVADVKVDVVADRLSSLADEVDDIDQGLQTTKQRVDRLDEVTDRAGGMGHLDARLSVQAKALDDAHMQINDLRYRVQQLEERLRRGPGLLPMVVANATEFANLKPQALAQMLLEKLAEGAPQE